MPWQPGPGRCGSGAGVSLASLSELKAEERSTPPAIFVTPAAASYTGRRDIGAEGRMMQEIFTVGGRVKGVSSGTGGRKGG